MVNGFNELHFTNQAVTFSIHNRGSCGLKKIKLYRHQD